MNNYVRKNNCIDKKDVINATNNIISILEKKKKVIIAHDRGKRKNAIMGRTIKYILNSAKKSGAKKPVIININLMNSLRKRVGSMIYTGRPSHFSLKELIELKCLETDEEIIGIVIDSYELMADNVMHSTELLHFIEEVKKENRILYEVLAAHDLFSEPVMLPFLIFRLIDNKFLKLAGIEGCTNLAELFYDTTGAHEPKNTGFIIHKKIAEYIDADLYNYVDENNFLLPNVSRHRSAEAEVRAALKKIREMDIEDGADIDSGKKRFHIIFCKNVKDFMDRYKDLITDFAKNEHPNVERIVACKAFNIYGEWDINYEYKVKSKNKKTIIFVANKYRFPLGPWFVAKDEIKSVSFISATGDKEYFPMSLEDFINASKIVYTSMYAKDKNRILVYCRDDFMRYDYYVEMQYLLKRDLPYKFNKNILNAFYDNYMKLGSLHRRVSKTIMSERKV